MSDTRAFQVDLHGVVDLLARHLYSGERVYLRELMQNGVDAITARRNLDPDAPATVRIRPLPDGALAVVDSGVGLTATEAEELLATVGRSSKRDDDLGLAREEFLGQFGIGLLSAFMVADRIELTSRSARDLQAPAVRWVGHADGSYQLETLEPGDLPVGSTVLLRPRRDAGHWLETGTVVALAEEFGSLLPVDLAVEVPLDDAAPIAGPVRPDDPAPRPGHLWRRISEPELPWRVDHPDQGRRSAELTRYCERALGFTPLAAIDLDVPLAGVTGVAYVLPSAVPPGGGGAHRVYLKRMLLGTRVDGLLPEWAFFVRCVIDASGLRPTASREQLYTDEVLLATQEALAGSIRDWLLHTLESGSGQAAEFVRTHHLAVRSLALTDDTMLDLAARILPYETTDGLLTLDEVAAQHGTVVYAATLEEYKRIAPVARAQQMAVVNAGYVYDADLLARLARRRPGTVRPLAAGDIAQVLSPVSPERELATLDALAAGNAVLADQDCELVLRRFEPATLPAVLLHDRDGDHQRALRRAQAEADDLWGDILAGFAEPAAARQLVLNDSAPLVRDLLAAPPGEVVEAGLRSLYVSALLLAGEPLRARESELMTGSMAALLRAGLAGTTRPTTEDDDAGEDRR
ncbi:HSP90 family protein [Cellulomonas denverensis]|uniref:HSP90 family protein n=1 Tax=Cellulomonas denverensis TaxID=264297 RepID=A0A7X6KXK7_9CELL|nr:HSP90 family protein [Cellulomonas denverensis]NKY23810.1 HSP90 family protein [Cellulomonas denverensis]GIG25182.1 molecular chaperone HtpG [Cellulomonas denverensis]